RVITYREIGPGRIEYTQVLQAPRCRDFKQQVFQEFAIAFSVENDNGHPAPIAKNTIDILHDDIGENRSLAGAGRTKKNALHAPDFIRPQLGVLIWISQDNGILLDRFLNITAVPLRWDIGRHSRPTLFALVLVREAIMKCQPHAAQQTNEIKDALNQ